MHELSLCQGAVELILSQVAGQGVKRVTAIWFEAGATACIEEESLRFAFEGASLGTILAGAQVHYQVLPGRAWCWGCDQNVEVKSYGEVCPHCGSERLSLEQNADLRVEKVEVE